MKDNNPLNDSSAITNLVKNPLGIIGLFILLVYGIASLLIGIGGKTIFSENQVWLLVIFLIGFPLVVLTVFYWLVTHHHEKLYAPKDYQNDDAFLKTISITKASKEEIREKFQQEQIIQNSIHNILDLQVQTAIEDMNAIPKESYIPSPMDMLTYQDVLDLEEKAIQLIEHEYSIKFDRNIKLGFDDDFILDAGYLDADTMQFFVAEIRILKSSFAVEIISRLLVKFIQLQLQLNRVHINLIVGILCDENEKNIIESKIKKLTIGLPIKVKINYLNISELTNNI